MKYYLLCLDNNKCSNPTKINGVRLVKDIPYFDEDNHYEPVELLAYETGVFYNSYMVDVITGKKIYLNDGVPRPNITYSSKREVSDSDLIRISEIYKELSNDELLRYKNGLEEIEKESIIKYNKTVENAYLYNNRLKTASTFLSSLIKEDY